MKLEQQSNLPLVLIVDDDQSTRMMAIEFLSQAGFTFAEASDGMQALEVVETISPDLILLDVEMPRMNGFEVCTHLRAMTRFATTPILMLTGLDNNQAIDFAYDAGATDFATKPVNWSLLCYRLKYMQRASEAAEELAQSQASLTAAQRIAALGNWSYECSSKQMIWSDHLYSMLGLAPESYTPSLKLFFQYVHPTDQDRIKAWLRGSLQKMNSVSIDFQIVPAEGGARHVRQVLEQVFDTDGKLIRLQATVQDFTERRTAEQRIHQLAFYDELTGLANRTLFTESVEKAIGKAQLGCYRVAVIYFDLDDFKRVNDTFGHSIGDKMLHAVGARLHSALESYESNNDAGYGSSFLARMSGDEFTLLVDKIDDKQVVAKLAEAIISVFAKPLQVEGQELFTSPSIGSAIYPEDGNTVDSLLKNADVAMYDAKRAGKNIFRFHSHDRDAENLRVNAIEERMRLALREGGFQVHYQPQLDLTNGRIDSAEALLRWTDDELGCVSPVEFIPIAEENGFILELGEWVLRTACQQTKIWTDNGFDVQRMAVNISVHQFSQTGFSDLIKLILSETGLDASQLKLEITESVLAVDTSNAVKSLQTLKQIGVMLSIDDFGTGYSSLSQLKNFPIDQLKIDQSFIRHLTENNDDMAIARAIIVMADSMNISVLAEGVETFEHLEFLRLNHCDEIQGYFISKPVSAHDLESKMEELNQFLLELFPDNTVATQRKAG